MKNLKRGYFFDQSQNLFHRANISPEKHLLHNHDDAICINAYLFDKYSYDTKWLGFTLTDGRKFIISKEDFYKYRFEVNYAEKQYGVYQRNLTPVNK
jgi:hypothetical protein